MTDERKTKGAQTREKILKTAALLFQRQGYAATGINQIIAESGQPKGSLYFHFPKGKQEIAKAAAIESSRKVSTQLADVFANTKTPLEATTVICMAFANQLATSGYQDGCPISPLATSASAEATSLRDACTDAYESWLSLIEVGLEGHGVEASQSRSYASLILSSVEGAILLSQARRNTEALDMLPASLAPLFAPNH